MADLASLRVQVDGSDAVTQAKNVTTALNQMGAAGQQAAAQTTQSFNQINASSQQTAVLGQRASQQVVYLGAGATAAARAAAGANAVFLPAATQMANGLTGIGNASGHATRGMMMATRGIDDLSRAAGLGYGSVGGLLFRGVEDLAIAFDRMGPKLGLLAAGFTALTVSATILKTALDAAGKDEELLRLLDRITGSSGTAAGALGQIKDLAAKGGFKPEEVVAGIRELGTTGLGVTTQDIQRISDAAAGTGASFQSVAAQVTKFDDAVLRNDKSIKAELESLLKAGLISTDTANKIAKLHDSGASAQAQIDLLTKALNAFAGETDKAGGTAGGLQRRLHEAFATALEPIGEEFLNAMKPGEEGLIEWLHGIGADIRIGVQGGGWDKLVEDLTKAAFANAISAVPGLIIGIAKGIDDAIYGALVPGIARAIAQMPQMILEQLNKIGPQAATQINRIPGIREATRLKAQQVYEEYGLQEANEPGSNLPYLPTGLEYPGMVQPPGPTQTGEEFGSTRLKDQLVKAGATFAGGGTGAAKADFKDLEALIRKVADAERDYANSIKVVDAEEKAGFTSAQNLSNAKLAGLIKERDTINSLIPQIQAQLDAERASMNPEQVEKWTQALKNAQQQVQLINVEIRQLSQTPGQAFMSGVQQAINQWGTLNEIVADTGKQITDSLASGITSGLTELISGTKKAKDAFKDMALGIINSIEQIIIKMLVELAIKQLLQGFGGGGFGGTAAAASTAAASGAQILGNILATGGVVQQNGYLFANGGPNGTDTVPAWLTPGEYVFSRAAVEHIGLAQLDAMHRSARGYAVGGGIDVGTGTTGLVPTVKNINVKTDVHYTSGRATTDQSDKDDAKTLKQVIDVAIQEALVREHRPGGKLWTPGGKR